MQPGLMVAPKLKLVSPLGKGGMGTVWIGEHQELGRSVAVKFLAEDMAEDPHATARFEREASAVAALKNPHVVEVIEYGVCASGLPYMVTELLEGEDLGECLAREGTISPEAAECIIDQLCEALAAAHEQGIVHRDIKPENVFLAKVPGGWSLRLLDFGIAKRWQDPQLDITHTGVVIGTPHYMSPEQLMSSKHVDYRADLWSVGVLAYRALVGRLPFDATNFAALCIQIHRARFPKPGAIRPELPPGLNAWFVKALRGHPGARFQSARAMAEAFREALRDSGPQIEIREEPEPILFEGDSDALGAPPSHSREIEHAVTQLRGAHADAMETLTAPFPHRIAKKERRTARFAMAAAFVAVAFTAGAWELGRYANAQHAAHPVLAHLEPAPVAEPTRPRVEADDAPSPIELRTVVVSGRTSAVRSAKKQEAPSRAPLGTFDKEPDRGF